KDKRLSRTECGMSEADFAKLDRNGDSWLDLGELANFAKHAPAVEGVVEVRSAGLADPLVIRNLGPVPAKALQLTRGQATFALDDANLVVQNLDGAGLRAPGLNQFAFIMQQIKAADTKMRGYVELTALETPELQCLRPLFPCLDR